MPTTNPPDQNTPPQPTEAASRREFGAALRDLRRWAGLTQKDLEAAHPMLTDSTISDHERGVRLPRLEWVHAYVTRCLRHRDPQASRPQLDAEFDHWRTAWTRLEHTDAGQTPAVPAQRVTGSPEASPPAGHSESTPTAPVSEPGSRERSPRHPWWRSRRAWVIGGAAMLVVAGGVIAAVTSLFDPNPPDTPHPVHASGTVENLLGVEGIDLDTNNRADQEAPGVDISPAATSTHLNAMANRVTFTVLPAAGAEERQRCVKAVDWMRQIPNIYDLTEGRNICVITDEGRFSMLTITKRATAATGTMNFHYTTWN